MDKDFKATKAEMNRRSELRRSRQQHKLDVAKQIAQLLAESQATCAELPEIWDMVYWSMQVRVKD